MATSTLAKKLEGKVAIITGGASGIGEASVRLFVENGARVVIGDIQDEKGARLVEEVGTDATAYKHCDVSQEREVESLVAFALEKWGRLDIMFNNAGIMGKALTKEVATMDMDDFDRTMSVNARGMTLGVKHASKAMLHANIKGSIICTASISGISGNVASVAYTMSKHAIIGLLRAASSDLGKHGIRVNCISPAGVITPLVMNHIRELMSNSSVTEQQAQQFCDATSTLAGHSLSAMDIAHGALYLASDDAAFISGHNLIIDGGLTACTRGLDN